MFPFLFNEPGRNKTAKRPLITNLLDTSALPDSYCNRHHVSYYSWEYPKCPLCEGVRQAMEEERMLQKQYVGQEFDFSVALLLAKKGMRIMRKGWNGKGMYVTHQKGYPQGIPINHNTADATGIEAGTICKFLPYLMIKTADMEATFVQWTPSQEDLFAEDYMIVV